MATFAERLDEALRDKGWSARQAQREMKRTHPDLAITHAYISGLRRGKHTNPSTEVVTALAQLFDVSVSWLFGEDPPPPQLSEEDQQRHQAVREGLAELGVQNIAERLVGLSPLSLEAIEKMVEAMRRAEQLDNDTDVQ
ncbi:helix-turn-helix domain-containing protein [Nonomuraea sp. NEAU-A123]|uniref:helix-turn-helix domain-containing protein n=1 Tax=Nonomuraea sp. NEAU-A123 TaxID=2839649 RepID=UPI001BE4B15F|nr:helix-turn-helix domain-containing protein [Nonomuraea sp. NEAU-A123]MBT2234810.1 helix-turn-helix domain-containing protein [Nonomuraea sp. NEAU-A123]